MDGPSALPLGYPTLRSGATQRITLAKENYGSVDSGTLILLLLMLLLSNLSDGLETAGMQRVTNEAFLLFLGRSVEPKVFVKTIEGVFSTRYRYIANFDGFKIYTIAKTQLTPKFDATAYLEASSKEILLNK